MLDAASEAATEAAKEAALGPADGNAGSTRAVEDTQEGAAAGAPAENMEVSFRHIAKVAAALVETFVHASECPTAQGKILFLRGKGDSISSAPFLFYVSLA